MKVLVTGGAGYIGSVTVDELINKGHEVIVIDNLSMGHKEAVNLNAQFYHLDLLTQFSDLNLMMKHEKFHAVIHLAAHTLVAESMRDPLRYFNDNLEAAINLLICCAETNVYKFIFSSTANVYNNTHRYSLITENDEINPNSPYGESKRIIERMLIWMRRIYGIEYTILRYFNAAGATEIRGEDHWPETHIIPRILQIPLGQRNIIQVYGNNYNTSDGTCVRDYVHVSDIASAHILALESMDRLGSHIYNLGSEQGCSIIELINIIRRVTNSVIPYEVVPKHPGDPDILIASTIRIRNALNWKPKHSEINNIIQTAWDWHKRHPEGYEH